MVETISHGRLGYLTAGQDKCYNNTGHSSSCSGAGQDSEFKLGIRSSDNRFKMIDELVLDTRANIMRTRNANITIYPMMWSDLLRLSVIICACQK